MAKEQHYGMWDLADCQRNSYFLSFLLIQPWVGVMKSRLDHCICSVLKEMMLPPGGQFGNYCGKFVFISRLSNGSNADSIAPSRAFWKFAGTFLDITIMKACYWCWKTGICNMTLVMNDPLMNKISDSF